MHPVGFSGAVTERSYAAVVFIPKEAHQCEWQCAMPRQLLVSWRRQQKVKRWLACRDAADMGQVVFAAWASAKRARTAFQVGA